MNFINKTKFFFNSGIILKISISYLFFFVFILYSNAGDSIPNAKLDYTTEKIKENTILKISFEAVFDTINYTLKNDSVLTSSKNTIEEIKSQLKDQILKNKKLQVKVDYPKYLNEIVNLITSENNRKKARKIYKENNIYKEIKIVESSDYAGTKPIFKKFHSKIYCEFPIFLTNAVNISFVIRPVIVQYFNKTYKSNSLNIELKK